MTIEYIKSLCKGTIVWFAIAFILAIALIVVSVNCSSSFEGFGSGIGLMTQGYRLTAVYNTCINRDIGNPTSFGGGSDCDWMALQWENHNMSPTKITIEFIPSLYKYNNANPVQDDYIVIPQSADQLEIGRAPWPMNLTKTYPYYKALNNDNKIRYFLTDTSSARYYDVNFIMEKIKSYKTGGPTLGGLPPDFAFGSSYSIPICGRKLELIAVNESTPQIDIQPSGITDKTKWDWLMLTWRDKAFPKRYITVIPKNFRDVITPYGFIYNVENLTEQYLTISQIGLKIYYYDGKNLSTSTSKRFFVGKSLNIYNYKELEQEPIPCVPKKKKDLGQHGKWFCNNWDVNNQLNAERKNPPKGFRFVGIRTHKQLGKNPFDLIPLCAGDARFWPFNSYVDRRTNYYMPL